MRIRRYELIADSEGAGQFRGGLGLRRDYEFSSPTSFTILADRDRWGPWGHFGGESGKKASYVLNPDREAVGLSSKVTLELEAGDVVSYRTCGGGGYGRPHDREAERVVVDVKAGKVSLERARSAYGVAIDPNSGEVDVAETQRLRQS